MKKYKVSYGFIAPFMIIFVLFTVAPVIIAMFFSLTNFNVLQPARFVGLENYKNLFIKDPLFLIALKNTILFAAITGPLSYLLCLWLAWFINDLRPRARAVLTLLFYAPTLANVYMVWQLIFSGDANGFLNAWLIKIGALVEPIGWLTNKQYMVPILMFIILWGSLGTTFLTFIAGFQTVNVSLYEAAAVDGIRNRWQELWYVTLPVMRPQLLFGAVMSITNSFGIGGVITALCGFPSTDYAAHTIMHHLEDYGTIRFQMGYACAIATVLFVMMVGVNLLVQKLIAKVGESLFGGRYRGFYHDNAVGHIHCAAPCLCHRKRVQAIG